MRARFLQATRVNTHSRSHTQPFPPTHECTRNSEIVRVFNANIHVERYDRAATTRRQRAHQKQAPDKQQKCAHYLHNGIYNLVMLLAPKYWLCLYGVWLVTCGSLRCGDEEAKDQTRGDCVRVLYKAFAKVVKAQKRTNA